MSTSQQEWAAFLALIPYFTSDPGPLKIRNRLLFFLRHCKEPILSRHALLLGAGLSFFADEFEVDLALMQLIREGVIRPEVDAPFTFVICFPHATGADRGTPSPSLSEIRSD